MQDPTFDAFQLDIDSFPDLLAAVARRALSDTTPSFSTGRRAEATDFLDNQIPGWRERWTPKVNNGRRRKVSANEQN